MIVPNWDRFKAKWTGRTTTEFERMCYQFFCKEHKKDLGIERQFNQAAIETEPIQDGDDVIGFQAKFYDTSLSKNKADLIKTIKDANRIYKKITILRIYTNQSWGQGRKKKDNDDTRPQALIDIENVAANLGVTIEWRTSSFFDGLFVCVECAEISKYYFEEADILSEVERRVAVLADAFNTGAWSTSSPIIDEKIEEAISEIRYLRFSSQYPKVKRCLDLAGRLIEGDLKIGSASIRAAALAQCARFISGDGELETSKNFLRISKSLADRPEAELAEAFIIANSQSRQSAITFLSKGRSDDRSRKTAMFIVTVNDAGAAAGLEWLALAKLTVSDLDVDGKIVYLRSLLTEKKWNLALEIAKSLNEDELNQSPVLPFLAGLTYLSNAIFSDSLKEIVTKGLPLFPQKFPLADDPQSISFRRRAIELFKTAMSLALKLNFDEFAEHVEDFVIWLELKDQGTYEDARTRLEKSFASGSSSAIKRLSLASSFGLQIKYDEINEEINRLVAMGSLDPSELSVARLVIAMHRGSPLETLAYINAHRLDLEMFPDLPISQMLEISALAQSGLIPEAEEKLNQLSESAWDTDLLIGPRLEIELAKGGDPIAGAMAHYENTSDVNDLIRLVALLPSSSEDSLKYALKLFSQTQAEHDACVVANVMSAHGKVQELYQFLIDNSSIVEVSIHLKCHRAWSLLRNGNLTESKTQLNLIRGSGFEDPSLDNLEVQLAIYSGNWDDLITVIEKKWESRDSLSSRELLEMVNLAKAHLPNRAREMLTYTAQRFSNDPHVLAAAYFSAAKMGFEVSEKAGNWLQNAIGMSKQGGPLHGVSLEEVFDMAERNGEHSRKVYKMYEAGELPLFVAAQGLNRSLSDFFLIQLSVNSQVGDIRRKHLVHAFDSNRVPRVVNELTVSIDPSTIFVLQLSGYLDVFLNYFEKIFIPHSLPLWLFDEMQQIAFHQPSQIDRAMEFERLVTDGFIQIVNTQIVSDPSLAVNIGTGLAVLLEEAVAKSHLEQQVVVVTSYPVYKVGSLLNTEVDLSKYHDVLTSCVRLVEKLCELGVISSDEFLSASNYLEERNCGRLFDSEISDEAEVYLDSICASYLFDLGILTKFKESGLKLFIHINEFDGHRQLRKYSKSVNDAKEYLDSIRRSMSAALSSGKMILSAMASFSPNSMASSKREMHPSIEIFQFDKNVQALFIDDQFSNRHQSAPTHSGTIPIYSTLDFIETLSHRGVIDTAKKCAVYSKLRSLGLAFIPIEFEQLNFSLEKSSVTSGKLKPSKELKLIKENITLLKIGQCMATPRDSAWLHITLSNIAKAIKHLWVSDSPLELVLAGSNWLFDLLDARDWAHHFKERGKDSIAYFGSSLYVSNLLIAPFELSREKKIQYYKWFNDNRLDAFKNFDPVSFEFLVTAVKGHIKAVLESDAQEEPVNEA